MDFIRVGRIWGLVETSNFIQYCMSQMHVLTVMLHFNNTVDFLYIKYLEIFYHIRTYSRLWMTIVSLLCIFVQYIEVNVWRECELVETLFLFKTGFLELLGEYRLSGQIGIQGSECLNIMFCVNFIPCLPWVGISDIFSTTGNLNVNAVNHNNFSWTDQWHSKHVFVRYPFQSVTVLRGISVVFSCPGKCWDTFLKQSICRQPDSYYSWASSHLISCCRICAFETPSLNNLQLVGIAYTRWQILTFLLT